MKTTCAEETSRQPISSTDKNRLRTAIDEYFAKCEEEGTFPDNAGLRLYLGLSQDEVNRLCDPETNDKWKAYRKEFDRARDMRESWLVREAAKGGKNSSAIMNILKEGDNGGYAKPEKQHAIVRITIDGRNAIEGGFNILGR